MLKTHLALCGLATALIAAPALAQSNPPTTNPPAATSAPATNAPATNAPATNAPAMSTSGAAATGQTQFYTNMSGSQWRASKFVGVDIYGANNEKIGDVNDIIIDNQGNINAVVIGVGGFLGIGEKDVAIPFKTVEWVQADRAASANANRNASGAMNTNSTASSNNNTPANNANTAAGTAGTGSNATDVTGTTVSGSTYAYPDHGVLRMTKQDLQNAPSFRYTEQANARETGGTTNPVPAGTKQ